MDYVHAQMESMTQVMDLVSHVMSNVLPVLMLPAIVFNVLPIETMTQVPVLV